MPNGQKGTKKGNHRHGFQLLLGGDSLIRVGPDNFSLINRVKARLLSPKQNKQMLFDFFTKNQVDLYLQNSCTTTNRESHPALTFYTSSPGEVQPEAEVLRLETENYY